MPDASNFDENSPQLIIERAKGLVPLILDQVNEAERNRNVSKYVIQRMREQELFRILQPKRFGGLELDITTVVRCCLEWSTADASVAWVAGLAMVHQWLIAMFPIKCQEEVWGNNPDAITFGSYAPSGSCEIGKDGYKVSGTWTYASGCIHGDWALLGISVPSDKNADLGRPGFVLVPVSDYSIEN